jgi:glycerate kinase
MNILIAPDKFKDALVAREVCQALKAGILRAMPEAHCMLFPLADGGEGTAMLLTEYANAIIRKSRVQDPLLRSITARWGFHPQKKQAFIELAEASGLQLLPSSARNPMHTTTYGTGELISAALQSGAAEITLGLGGSATHDGGTGMAAALGYRFYDGRGKIISKPCGKDLLHIRHIDVEKVNPLLHNCLIKAACDVDNPLTGPQGAAYTFALQKGATKEDLTLLEDGLCQLAELLQTELGITVQGIPGGGAAGGAGAGVLAFLRGSLQRGAELIMAQTQFSQKLQMADLLVSGEGKLDASSLQGKLLSSLSREAKKKGKKMIVFCGSTNLSAEEAKKWGIHAVIAISPAGESLEKALKNTGRNLQEAATSYFSDAEIH